MQKCSFKCEIAIKIALKQWVLLEAIQKSLLLFVSSMLSSPKLIFKQSFFCQDWSRCSRRHVGSPRCRAEGQWSALVGLLAVSGWVTGYSFHLPKLSTGSAEDWQSSHFLLIPFHASSVHLVSLFFWSTLIYSLVPFCFFFFFTTFYSVLLLSSPYHVWSLCFRLNFTSSSNTSPLISFSPCKPLS